MTGFGLGVNFHKSSVIRINVNSNFLLAAANFLSCRIENKSFLFLGIPVGIIPHHIKSWKFLVDKVKAKFAKWKGKLSSFGGRITLIKSVLSSVAIFLRSFYNNYVCTMYKDAEEDFEHSV